MVSTVEVSGMHSHTIITFVVSNVVMVFSPSIASMRRVFLTINCLVLSSLTPCRKVLSIEVFWGGSYSMCVDVILLMMELETEFSVSSRCSYIGVVA